MKNYLYPYFIRLLYIRYVSYIFIGNFIYDIYKISVIHVIVFIKMMLPSHITFYGFSAYREGIYVISSLARNITGLFNF